MGDSIEYSVDLTPEERLRELADVLISSVLRKDEESDLMRNRLYSTAKPELFRDENYILYKVIQEYKGAGIIIDEEFLKLFLTRNRHIVGDSRAYIDVEAYGDIDGDYEAGYAAGVIKHFNRIKSLPQIGIDEFNTDFEKYIIEFQAIQAENVYSESIAILTDTKKVKGKVLSGFKDSTDFVKKSIAEIEGLVDNNKGKGFVGLKDLLREKDEIIKPELISDWGEIYELNKELGGVFTQTLYTILAPPKAGKSKFCTRVAHNALLNNKNITVWAQEGGMVAWAAQLRAIHFDYIYNSGKGSVVDKKLGVSQATILYDRFEKPEYKDLELASKEDLITNIKYGNVDFIDRPFQLESFMDDIDTSVKANNSRLVIIDYMQLLGTQSKKSRREVLTEAYPMLLNYAKKNDVAIVSPAQYTQEIVKDISKNADAATKELRTAAGESSEIIRSSDIVLAFWASTEELRNNTMSILSIPARFNKAFEPIEIYADLGTCSFMSIAA